MCVGNTTTLTDGGGGTWASGNTPVATAGTGGIVGGVSTGTAAIIYTLPTGCSTTKIVTVNPLPNAGTITGIATVCALNTTTLADAAGGGTWSSSTGSIATVGSTGIVTGVSAGTAAISYSVTNSCGTAVATKVVTVNPLPVAGSITGIASMCVSATTALSDAAPGGAWSSGNTALATVGSSAGSPSTGTVTGITAGTATISYVVINGCGTAVATRVVTVNPIPIISGPSAVCAGVTMTESGAPTGGTWTPASGIIATVSPSGVVYGVTIGTAAITYTLATGCVSSTVVSVSLSPTGIIGAATVCAGSVDSLGDAVGGGSWSSSNTAAATVGSLTGQVLGITPGTTTITYSLGTGCTVNKMISVNATPAAITGALSACAGTTTTLSDATAGGAWSSPPAYDPIATINASGKVSALSAGTDTISYSHNGCAATAVFTVYATPAIITGVKTMCAGATTILNNTVTGGVWTSANTAIATVGTTGTVSGIAAGTATISYSLGTCYALTTVTVNPLPDAGSISGLSLICTGSHITLTDAAAGGTWSASNAHVSVDATGTANGNTAGTDTISYTVINGCGTAVATKTVTVNAAPTAGTIIGPTTVCAGATINLSDAVTGGSWSSSATGIATISSAGVVTGASAGSVIISYTVTYSCGTATATSIIGVTAAPAAGTITGASSVCQGAQ